MAGLMLFYVTVSTFLNAALADYCYYYGYSGGIFGHSYLYTKYCAFGCCGNTGYQYCCVTNVGYIVGIVISVLFVLALIISVSCCCVRRRRLATAGTVVTTVPVAAVSTSVTNAQGYSTVAYTPNYGYNPDHGQPQYPAYPTYPAYPANQGYGNNFNEPMNEAKPYPPPNYISSPPPSYNAASGLGHSNPTPS